MHQLAPTTPTREIANADHRIRYLERALREEPRGRRATRNKAELVRLQDVREGWAGERERNRAAWIRYHHRQRRTLIELARRHHVALIKLLGAGEVIAGEEPSENGTGKHK
jgi:hypothetical protein